jgi:FG-GAP-like repeat
MEPRRPADYAPAVTKTPGVVLGALLLFSVPAAGAGPAAPTWGPPLQVGALPPEASEAAELLTVDLNGDGLRDAVVAPNNMSLATESRPVAPVFLVNRGGGRFENATQQLFAGPPPLVDYARELLTADFNRDGRPDVFIADHGHVNDADPNQVRNGAQQHLILSTSDGRFVDASGNLPQRLTFTHSAAVADVNGDGAPDLFLNSLPCCSVSHAGPEILLNDGTGHFSIEPDAVHGFVQDLYGNSQSYACAFADVNGDGAPDLIQGGAEVRGANSSRVLLNDGHGRFAYFATLPPTIGPPNNAFVIDMKPADVNGDGAIDLVFGETLNDPWYVGTSIQVLINDGHGHFADETATRFPDQPHATRWSQRVLVEDVDDDGRPDVTVQFAPVGSTSDDLTAVYLNRDGAFQRIQAPSDGFQPQDSGPVGYVNGDGPHALLSIEFRTLDNPQPSRVYVTPQLVAPAAPTGVHATRVRTGVRVTWARVPNALRYDVQRNGKTMATTTATSIVDRQPGKRPSYTVRARNTAGTSADSAPARP